MKTPALLVLLILVAIGCGDEADATSTSSSSGAGASGTSGVGAGGSASTSSTGGTSGSGASGGGGPASCVDVMSPTGAMSGTLMVGGQARTYELSVPSSYEPATPLPIVFAWHGAGGDGALAKLYFGVEAQAAGSAIFVYPDGLVVQTTGTTGWDLTPGGQDVAFFDALLADISQRYCIDDTRVFSTGHSFGGYFSNALGCARGDVLRAIAPVAGGGPFFGGCTGALAAWITHGANDDVVELEQGVGSRDHWLAQNGCGSTTTAVTPSPCEAYDGCEAGADVHWCEHTGEHEWPSFAAQGIWSFFASQ